MRVRYRRRRDTLVGLLGTHVPHLEILGTGAGLNLLVRLTDVETERRALAAANAAGIGLDGLASGGYYELRPAAGLIVGYAAAPEHAFDRAAATLATTLAGSL
jgi:GntR family transcriptional regulator/MocR family aminotransferase